MTAPIASCGKTHREHATTWRTYRDDCRDCGFALHDPEQCALGHPDDGITFCGACGHGVYEVAQ